MFIPDRPDDVRVFCSRAQRLDPAALVRLRPGESGYVELWCPLPITVLANLTVPGHLNDSDVTVCAKDLSDWLKDGREPARVDGRWRGSLPSGPGEVLEELPSAECRRVGEAAAVTLRQARGQGIGDRRLRDALLDQVVLRVSAGGAEHEIRLRLIIGLLRMGFAVRGMVRVRRNGGRLGLEGTPGTVWTPLPGLLMR